MMFQTNLFSDVAEVESYIAGYPGAHALYHSFRPEWKTLVQGYFLSRRTLPLTYDPFFKRIFDADIHRDRLSRLISSILGQKVTVSDILPCESTQVKGNALLIMDIVVRLSDGSLTTVEIQKISAAFPAERMSCYSADLLLRQYEQVKSRMKKDFSYSAMNKVYTIVIFENTDPVTTNAPVYRAFHEEHVSGLYLHHGKTVFNTRLNLEFLQEFYLISLDVFREVGYAKDDSELTAWLSLLVTHTYEDAELLCSKYPWMEEIFREISEYVQNPEEVIGMFSEALKMMDDNMYQYMADQHMALVKQQEAELLEKDAEIQKQQVEIQNQQTEIQNLYLFIINQMKQNNESKESVITKLQESFRLTPEQAESIVEANW